MVYVKCPFCGSLDSKVIDSRHIEESNSIKRRRECLSCEKRFSTFEKIETAPLMVVKKNGVRQEFDRNKVLMGIRHACEKRPVPLEVMEKIAFDIEFELSNQLASEVDSIKIGEMVMDKLKNVDEVAYVRFASVYRQFKDINTFKEELEKLLK